jgi:hypothetical protein
VDDCIYKNITSLLLRYSSGAPRTDAVSIPPFPTRGSRKPSGCYNAAIVSFNENVHSGVIRTEKQEIAYVT